jgi:hypothetical protein
LSRFFYPDGRPVDHEAILGNPEFGDDNLLSNTQLYVTYLDLPFTDKGADVEEIAVDRILSLQEAWDAEDGNKFHLELFAARSFSDEFERAIIADIPLVPGKFSRTPHLFSSMMPSVAHSLCFPGVFIVMSIFTCLVFFKCDKVRSRTLLGFGAVVCVLISIMTGYGLLFLIGKFRGKVATAAFSKYSSTSLSSLVLQVYHSHQ